MLGDKQEATFGGVMSAQNTQVIPVSVLHFSRYFIFKYVVFVALSELVIGCLLAEKGQFLAAFWCRRRQCIKMTGTSRRPNVATLSQHI